MDAKNVIKTSGLQEANVAAGSPDLEMKSRRRRREPGGRGGGGDYEQITNRWFWRAGDQIVRCALFILEFWYFSFDYFSLSCFLSLIFNYLFSLLSFQEILTFVKESNICRKKTYTWNEGFYHLRPPFLSTMDADFLNTVHPLHLLLTLFPHVFLLIYVCLY